MTIQRTNPKELGERLLNYLRQLRHDRGAMADLRRALSPAQRHRAWPWLAPVGGIGDRLCETVAGLFAHHPDEISTGNLGTTCWQLRSKYNTFEGRFRRLLACERNDICGHIRPVVLAARAKGIPVNYEQLFADLFYWGDTVKAHWAAEFLRAPMAGNLPAPTEATP